jgi:hypothetical protein
MSFGTKQSAAADTTKLSGLDPDQEPTAQEAIVASYWAGTRKVPAQWLSPVYNERAVEAPQTRPGKK